MNQKNLEKTTTIKNFAALSMLMHGLATGLGIPYPTELCLKTPTQSVKWGKTRGAATSARNSNNDIVFTRITLKWNDDFKSEWTLCHEMRHLWQAYNGIIPNSVADDSKEEYYADNCELDADAFAATIMSRLYQGTDLESFVQSQIPHLIGGRDLWEIKFRMSDMNLENFDYEFLETYKDIRGWEKLLTPEMRLLRDIFGVA